MCILLPCADPAAPGVWWRDDAQWRRYPPHLENAVRDAIARRLPSVDLGTFVSDGYPNGARYTADLRAMKQRNAQSGYAREIRVIGAALPAPAPSQALGMPNQQGLQLPGGAPMPTIHWRDSRNNLRQYDAATARAIFRAGAQGYMCAQTAPIITDAYPLGVVYTIDLQRMVQRNPFTGRERDVVVQFPHNPLELLKLALGATGQDCKQLFGATLEAFCSEDNVMKMLAGKISPYQIIAKRRNPNLQLGQPVFDKFVESMEGIATGCANLSPSNLVDGQTQASGLPLPLQLAFHGTPPENINSIFKEGMSVGGASASFYQRLGSGTGRLVAAAVAASNRAAGPLVASHIAHRVVWLQPAKGLLQPSAAAVTPAVVGPAGPGLGALPVGVARLPIAVRQSAIGGLLSLSAVALGALGWARACSAEDERSGARAGEQEDGSPEASAVLGQSVGEDEAEAVISRVASVADGRKRPRETDGGSVPQACVATASVGAERGVVVEPKTKHSFPVMLRQEGQGGGLLAGVGIRDTVIARIKSIKIYAFGLYVSPASLGGDEHLKAKYGAMPLDELRVSQEFYDDLLSRDIGMTVRLVLHYRGLNMKMVRNALNTSLSNRLTKLLGHADDPGFHTLNEYLSQPHQVKRGTTIDFTWQPGGTLLTEIDGRRMDPIVSAPLCRAFFDLYIGHPPVCEKAKQRIGENIGRMIATC
ncbi:unnamed protein product [Closterium sp. NIES-64]|nr:unnamed protein product [Closterium sp. NIES-64]